MKHTLEIDSVTKSFGDRPILTDIYLKCCTGDIIGLLGRNGTGKSTLLKILFGTMTGEYQFIRIDDRVIKRPFKNYGDICYLPQHNFLPKGLKVYQAIKLCLEKDARALFMDDEIIQKNSKNSIGHLSGGEMRYLEIKLLLNSACKFVLLDEPFNGVSPVLVEQLKQMIRLHSATKGIILTDHDYRNVLDVAGRYCLLHDGGIRSITEKQELVRWNYVNSID